MANIQQCRVTATMIKTYKQPKIDPHPVHTFTRGTPLAFIPVQGQKLPLNHPQNSNWGFNPPGKFYFWLGDTDHPNSHLSPQAEEDIPINSDMRVKSGSLESGGNTMGTTEHCAINVAMLKTYSQPDVKSPLVHTKNKYIHGMHLTFTTVPNHNGWGLYNNGDHFYFSLGDVTITSAVASGVSESK